MKEIQKAKFFKTGGSKALRIPASVFSGVEEVWLQWDEVSQTLTITHRNPKPFEQFFKLLEELGPAPVSITEELAEIRREADSSFERRAKRLEQN